MRNNSDVFIEDQGKAECSGHPFRGSMHRRIARETSNEVILHNAAIVRVREETSPGGETDESHEFPLRAGQ
jgi:hypothetical protein